MGQRALEIIAYLPSRDDLGDYLNFAFNTVRIADTEGADMVICRASYEGGVIRVW